MIILLIILILKNCKGYLNNWYPIVPISTTNFKNPRQIRILGKDLVLWKKGKEFVIQNDVCPHRCAPLSEGYIDKTSNNIRCSYHGWEFNEKGKCEIIPQLEENIKINEKKSCVKTYKTQIYGDLLWVYMGDKDIDKYPYDLYNIQEGDVYTRDLAYGLHILLENFFDPAHIPFAHHKLQGFKERAKPIKVELVSNMNDTNKFSVIFNETDNKIVERVGKMTFNMPCHYTLESLEVNSKMDYIKGINIFVVPIQEDKTRLFVQYNFDKTSVYYKLYNSIPVWIRHLFLNKFLDSDSYILHAQEKYLLRNKNYNDNNEYYTPSSSDKSIRLYRKWIKQTIPELPYIENHDVKKLTRKEALDVYEQHTKNCKVCSETLNSIIFNQNLSNIIFCYLFITTNEYIYILAALIHYFGLEYIKKKFIFEDYIHNEID